MKKVLITASNFPTACAEGLKMLQDYGCECVISDKKRMFTREEMLEAVGDVNGIIAHCEPWDDDLFDHAPNLEIIARFGVGYDSIDLAAASRHNVKITNCPGINANAVAEHTVGLLISLERQIPMMVENLQAGRWVSNKRREIRGKKIGVLGFGTIAQLVCKKLRGFEADITVYNRSMKQELADELGVQITTDMDKVLAESDYLLIHLPVAENTKNIINAENIAKMKDGIYIVNTARGALVNEADVLAALESGKIGGFAADVYKKEPVDMDNPLLKHPNFLGTPHAAGETYENYGNTGIATAQALIDVF